MEKLRDKKKHDHLLTKLLKASIFSIVMLAPFFAILTKCIYVAFNKNAKDSYSATPYEYIDSEIIDNSSQLNYNTTYHYESANQSYTGASDNFMIANVSNFSSPQFAYNNAALDRINNANVVRFFYNPYQLLFTYTENGVTQTEQYVNTSNYNVQFDFEIVSYPTYTNKNYGFTEIKYLLNNSLDNVFYYAVNQLDEMPLFNWTKNTGLYTTLNAMCSGLDIGTNILAILLTYWALMTAIYIVFDIIIELFTKITHILA